MGNKKAIGRLAAMAMMMADESVFLSAIPAEKEMKTLPPLPIHIPTGCKEYFFNAEGEFSNSHMRKDECIFWCYAINDKNAIKKFKNSLGKIIAK